MEQRNQQKGGFGANDAAKELVFAPMLCRHNPSIPQHSFTGVEHVSRRPLSGRYPHRAPLCVLCFGWASIWVFNLFDHVSTVEAIATHALVITMVVCILAHPGWPFDVAPGDVILFVVFLLLALPDELLAPRALVWVVLPALVLT